MSLNTSILVDTLLQTDITPNDLIVYFDSIIKLIKKYWKTVYTTQMLAILKEADITIYLLLEILIKYKKQNIADIAHLSKSIQQKSKNYIPTFTIHIPKKQYKEAIEKNIKKVFPNSQIQTQENIELGVSISWEWRHYKRDIDQDIQKLLG